MFTGRERAEQRVKHSKKQERERCADGVAEHDAFAAFGGIVAVIGGRFYRGRLTKAAVYDQGQEQGDVGKVGGRHANTAEYLLKIGTE